MTRASWRRVGVDMGYRLGGEDGILSQLKRWGLAPQVPDHFSNIRVVDSGVWHSLPDTGSALNVKPVSGSKCQTPFLKGVRHLRRQTPSYLCGGRVLKHQRPMIDPHGNRILRPEASRQDQLREGIL